MPPPTAERLKVRCYRCNQLLAVAPGKAGAVVACPKCKSELLIPRPEDQPAGVEPSSPGTPGSKSGTYPSVSAIPDPAPTATGRAGSPPSSFLDEIAALIPPEVAALRPEDLRVEAEFLGSLTREPASTSTASDPFWFPGVTTGPEPAPPPAAAEPGPAGPLDVSSLATSVGAAAVESPPPLPIALTAPDPKVIVPPISIEPDAIRPPSAAEPRTIRDVTLPASVVLAWSLLVLFAVPLAFVAGLMVGHFIWKIGP
jgi:phage FluMu protein Com